jgi:hypothetical protein
MYPIEWGLEYTDARQRLLESGDFHLLRSRRHQLKDGVVLTSVSELPFEMSFKCVNCGAAFWFENAAWSTGGISEWRLSRYSEEAAAHFCSATGLEMRCNERMGRIE